MKKTLTLNVAKNSKDVFLKDNEGGTWKTFEGDIYRNINAIKGLAINYAKSYKAKFCTPKDEVELIDATGFQREVCEKCGSIHVDIKCWVSEVSGYASKPEDSEEEDNWCNDCQNHTKTKFKTNNYVLWNSKEEENK